MIQYHEAIRVNPCLGRQKQELWTLRQTRQPPWGRVSQGRDNTTSAASQQVGTGAWSKSWGLQRKLDLATP